ncbi:MAG: hypothetical protein ACREMF_01130 [Gemmatimonadales bacterium]
MSAQASVHAALGARYTSTLVHDSIVNPLDVRADLAPALTVALDLPLDGPWKLEVLADVATSPVRRHDASGATTSITRVWTVGVGLGLRRRLESWLEGRAAVGGLKYLPTESIGLFGDGGGNVIPYGSLAFDVAHAAAFRRRVGLELTGDVHRFLTPALRGAGFTDSRFVYRVTLGVRADLWRGR